MLADRTVLTVMPATTWKVPNADLAAALREELQRVGRMVEAASG